MSKEKILHDRSKPEKRSSSRFFVAPTKEGATTGRFMDAGDDYGVGKAQPISRGKGENPIPFGCLEFNADDAVRK